MQQRKETKMINYTNLIKNLEVGKHCIIKDSSGLYKIISPFKDNNNNHRTTYWRIDLKYCHTEICGFAGHSKENLKEFCEKSTFIGFYEPEFKIFKKGDKVKIADNAKELCDKYSISWDNNINGMLGKVLEIEKIIGNDISIYDETKSDSYMFPIQAISYSMDEISVILKIGDKSYSKQEIEEALKNIKPTN